MVKCLGPEKLRVRSKRVFVLLECCVKDWCAKVICQRFAKTRTRMIEKGPQGCFNGVLSIYR